MKKVFPLILSLLMLLLPACRQASPPAQLPETQMPVTTTETEATEPSITEPLHTELYIPDLSVEDVILYFNEVCLDSEFVSGGDPSVVQKWTVPIYYTVDGACTDQDLAVLSQFIQWLNTIPGFPGIFPIEDINASNLHLHFCDGEEMVFIMGQEYDNLDGGVTFWYDDNEIYDCVICYRTEIDQQVRNSVILEELYNGLGPMQDTSLREDSIAYQFFSTPQWLSPVDELLLRLLYHPDILPGMDAQQCEQVIRRLYY